MQKFFHFLFIKYSKAINKFLLKIKSVYFRSIKNIPTTMKSQNIFVILLTTVSILFQLSASAQADSSQAKKSYFKVQTSYLSNSVYSGRKDSETVSYLTPSIGYFHKSGFYVDGQMSFLSNSTDAGRIDEIVIETGYDFSINDLFDAGFYAGKYFYSNSSFAVTSDIKADLGTYFTFNTNVVNIGGGADLLVSTNNDLNINGNIAHAFNFSVKKADMAFSPTAEINAGTQSFYRAYYENRKFAFTTHGSNGQGRGHNKKTGTTTTTTTDTSSFQTVTFPEQNHFSILDYEFSIPMTYDAKKWGVFLTPVVAVPLNPATYAINGILQKEKLSTSFFVKAGVYFKF